MKNPITTITGVIMIVISALTLFGVISSEDQIEVQQLAAGIIEGVAGLIAIFKAGDKGGV